MDSFLRDILEDYLSGNLSRPQKARLEAHLAEHPEAAEQLEDLRWTSRLVGELRAPEDAPVGPEPGFYARVMQRLDEQHEEPFWAFLLQPVFMRRLAFGSLMWLALVGGYVVTFGDAEQDARRMAEAVLTEQPSSDYYRVRLGNDLEQNRDSMLASVVLTAGE